MTAELKWGKYVYDRCTGFKRLWEHVRPRGVATLCRRNHAHPDLSRRDRLDHRGSARTPGRQAEGPPRVGDGLQQQYPAVQAKIDRASEDRLSGNVSDDLWQRKTQQWERALADIRRDTALHESASHDYAVKGPGF